MTYGGADGLERYSFCTQQRPLEATNPENTMKITTKKMNKKLMMKKARGQGMTEYIIIVALIAIAAIGVITLFGDNIRALFGQSANALAGETTVTKRTNVSKGKDMEQKGLKNFSENNSAGY
jgi:Flp pilus assembly pilin Flp